MTTKQVRKQIEERQRDRGDSELRLIMIYGSVFCAVLIALSLNTLGG